MPLNMEMTPFNIKLLQLTPVNIGRMQEVTSLDVFDGASRNFHGKGLFSVEIFGRMGDKLRMRNFAYIDIKAPILHPLVVRIMGKLKRLYPEILHGKAYAIWDKEQKDFVKSDPVHGETGYHFFMTHWEELKLTERMSDLRELNIKFINKVRQTALNERVIVSPAGYRDYVIHADGREESDEVNELYYRLLSLANNLTRQTFKTSPASFDRTRSAMQRTFDAIYEYHEGIVVGKNKLTEGKLLSRQVKYGTRNVIITQNLEVKELFAPDAPTVNSTGIGLFQYLKAYQPPCTFQVKNGYVSEVFSEPGTPANLVNPKTWHAEKVHVPNEIFSMWMTFEGMNKLFNLYGEENYRHDEIKIGDHYFGLIYNDGKYYRIFNNIEQLPERFDRKFVRPVTYTELFYDAVYAHVGKYILNVTRFPVTGSGSIYPSVPLLKPTLDKQTLIKLNAEFEEDPSIPIAYQFPVRGARFLNAAMPAPNKLKNLGADFDGDKTTNMGIMMEESLQEGHRILRSRNFYVKTDGTIAHSMATDTVNFLIKGMMRNVEDIQRKKVTPAEIKPAREGHVKPFPAKSRMFTPRETTDQSYREEADSAFTHNGKTYNINKVLDYIEANKIVLVSFRTEDLSWVLQYDTPDPERVKRADVKTPIIVVEHYSETAGSSLTAVDGLHRVAKAVQDRVQYLRGYELTTEQLNESQRTVAREMDEPGMGRYTSPGDASIGILTTLPQPSIVQGSALVKTITTPLAVNRDMTDGLATLVNGVLTAIPEPIELDPATASISYSRSDMRNLPDDLSYVRDDDIFYVHAVTPEHYRIVKGADVYRAHMDRGITKLRAIVVPDGFTT